jgi:hypothetical protein
MILNDTKKEENELDTYFTKESILIINKNVKEANYYAFDKFGLIIRRKAYNDNKSIFGWIYNDYREPISIHIDQYLMKTDPDRVFTQTIQKLRYKYPKEFSETSGKYNRVSKSLNILFE